MLVLLAYAVVLMVVNQLAMHSLAHNRRGVSSALTHAWRIIKASPMSVLRATVVDFVLVVSVFLAIWLLGGALDTLNLGDFPSNALAFCIFGITPSTETPR